MLVGQDRDRVALALRNVEGHDLILEATLRNRRAGAALALCGELILRLARDVVAVRDFLRGATHLVAPERVCHQGDGAVDQGCWAQPPPHLRPGQEVWLDGHVLVSAGDHHPRLTLANLMHSAVDRLQPGPAKTVHVVGGGALREAGFEGRQPRVEGILSDLSHTSEDDLVDRLGRDPGAGHRRSDRRSAQVRGRGVLERPGELTDRRASSTGDHHTLAVHGGAAAPIDVRHHQILVLCFCLVQTPGAGEPPVPMLAGPA